ncbi:hypothetical protein SSP35_02_00720 [Streptomyces sp. NBRC 110611]|uniref:DUF998 domain-containing protein n=1 Tax=Streptomyces sp. NBRC 110611 TaxID=1621259 RepID=UPI000857FCEF|nr:DUF998 domain-containing protein [Streptomyces sp. NBRC 110611]GAU65705.1 hypothetical protein SSP35_02_00720 [Streptomyces sp. NBRC 110611]
MNSPSTSHPENRTSASISASASATAPASVSASRAARIGAAGWLVAAVQILVVQLVVAAGWDTVYSWAEYNISDLGNVHCQDWDDTRLRYVCSPLHGAMNASFVVHGVLLLAGTLLTGACWGRGRIAVGARVLLTISAGGWVLVGLVPADVDENLHVLGAMLIMGLGNLGLLCAGFAPVDSLFGKLRLITLAMAATAVLAAWMFFGQHDPGIGMGGLERVAAFTLDAWVLVMALAIGLGNRAFPMTGSSSR